MEDDDAAKLFATDEIIIFVWPPLFRQTSDPPLFIQISLKFASKDLTREKRKNHRFHEYKLVFWKWISVLKNLIWKISLNLKRKNLKPHSKCQAVSL